MNRRPWFGALALMLAVGLIAAGWWLGRNDATAARARSAGGASTAVSAAVPQVATINADATASPSGEILPSASSGPASTAAASLAPEPLPAADAAVSDVFDELLARARRGDSRAACRLASDLQRCQRAQLMQGMMPDDMTSMISRADDERRRNQMIDYVARMEEEREHSDRICAGVTGDQLDQTFALQLQAAQARPEMRSWVALNPGLDQRFFVNDLDRWQQYRQIALPWLESAAAAGDLTAVIAMARIHGDDRPFGPRNPPLRLIDDARMVTYARLLERYGANVEPIQRAAEAARGRLDPQAQALAEERATELFRPEAMPAAGEAQTALRTAMNQSFAFSPPNDDCD